MSAKSEQAKKASHNAARAAAPAAVAGSLALIRNGAVVANDIITLADDAPAPSGGKIIVSLARWQKEADALKGLSPGVRIPNTADVTQVGPGLLSQPLIVLEFLGFADGRAYSQATLLRDALGYKGELRATGAAVMADQLFGMARCGINAFELRADQNVDTCLKALAGFSFAYQPAQDHVVGVVQMLRRARG